MNEQDDYTKYLTQLTGSIMKSIEKYGLIPTAITLCILCGFITMMVLAWNIAEIITAIRWW